MSEWKKVRLGEIAEIEMGQSPHGEYCNVYIHGIPLLNGPTEFGSYSPTPQQYTTHAIKFAKKNDILFCVRGSTTGRMNWADQEYAIGRGLAAIRHKKGDNYRYFLKGVIDYKLNNLLSITTGSTFPNISRDQLEKLEIYVPDVSSQKKISHFLEILDEKIELNNCINGNLEEQAQAIFKEWFLDNAKPEWKEGKFTDLIDIFGGGTPNTNEASYWNGTIPFFTPKDVSTSCYIFSTEKNITEDGLHHCNSRLYPPETVFITARGTVGKVAIAGTAMAMNQSCYALQGKGCGQLFTYYETLNIVKILQNKANGAVFDAITTRDFESENIVIPDTEMLTKFEEKVKPLYTMMKNNCRENIKLEQIRNAILPKLMKGEINI